MDRGKEKITDDAEPELSPGPSSWKKKRKKKEEILSPPFSWLTDRRAVVHSHDYLLSNGISAIFGEVECRSCGDRGTLTFNLQEKFKEVYELLEKQFKEKENASQEWMSPKLPSCPRCMAGSLSPVMAPKKRDINWLFLFLGRMLGCCSAEQLGYFCKHNEIYPERSMILLFVYIKICLQLDPTSLA